MFNILDTLIHPPSPHLLSILCALHYKLLSIPFVVGTKLNFDMCPNFDDDIGDMSSVPYASAHW